MARKILTALDLAQNELQNARVQNLASAPGSPVKGQLYYNSTGGNDTLYWWDGTTWQAAKSGAPSLGAVVPQTSFGAASTDGVASTVSRSDHAHGTPAHSAAAHSAIKISDLAAPTASVSMGSQLITSLLAPVSPTDAANKAYVDGVAQGLAPKDACRIASTANLGLTGLAAIDGITPIANDRILVKNQSTPAQNGIYLAASGAWSRALDMDIWAEFASAFTFVEEGSTQADTGWTCTNDTSGTLGTTAVTFVQFSGAGAYTAGAGLTQSGTTFAVGAGSGITVNADDVAATWGGTGSAATVARSDHNHDSAYPPVARSIGVTAPITGGGDLSANRTIGISSFAGSVAGAVPASAGGTANFLRADGSWSAPAGGGTVSKYSVNIGGATSVVVNHALGTRDCVVDVYRVASPYDTVECDIERTDTANVTVRFAVAPAAAEYRCVVMA